MTTFAKHRPLSNFEPLNHQNFRYPIIDGNLITANPLQKIIDGDVKSDLGFYYHEDSHDEAGFLIYAISSLFIVSKSN